MEWYHIWWPWLTSKHVTRFVSNSRVSCVDPGSEVRNVILLTHAVSSQSAYIFPSSPALSCLKCTWLISTLLIFNILHPRSYLLWVHYKFIMWLMLLLLPLLLLVVLERTRMTFSSFFEHPKVVPALLANKAVFFSYGIQNVFQNAPFEAKINNQKMSPSGAIFKPKIHQNALAAWPLPVLPRSPSWFSGSYIAVGEGGERGKWQFYYWLLVSFCLTAKEAASRMSRGGRKCQ